MGAQSAVTLSKNEGIKARSRALRGTIAEGLGLVHTGSLAEDDTQLTKFHGIYQQDDRDLRAERGRKKLEPAYSFMARLRIPGGVVTPAQWLALDDIARTRANGTIRLTTRETVQFHGIIKGNLRPFMQGVNDALLDTLAACGDVNRNVMAAANPAASPAHAAALDLARSISTALLPRSRAWHEIWLGDTLVAGGEAEDEPLYGATYLPRKFKVAIAVPPQNDVDVFAHDLGFIAHVDEAGAVTGWDVTAGGGMGMTHGEPDTFPRTADLLGHCTPGEAVAVAAAVMMAQRDHGNRAVRKHARLKYTIEAMGLDAFRAAVEAHLGRPLAPPRGGTPFTATGDRLGWYEGVDGSQHYGLFVETGRVNDAGSRRLLSGLRAIANVHAGTFVLTPNQNLVIAGVDNRADIEGMLREYGLDGTTSPLRQAAIACVALPTCGLALAESERFLPSLISDLDDLMAGAGLASDSIVVRMTGCPNGCARPYLAEIGLVGRGPGTYNLYLGAAPDGTRLNKLHRRDLDHAGILETLRPLLHGYAADRTAGERFGDWVVRAGHVAATTAGNRFHLDLSPDAQGAAA